jgi:hypothetical protein
MNENIPKIFNPRDRLHMQGMVRQSVGGNAPRTQSAVDGVQQERGVTYPVNVSNISQMWQDVDLSRKFLYLLNNDPLGVVWVSFGGAGAGVGQGMRLAPGGGGILLDINVPTAKIFLIGTIAVNVNVTAVIA